MSSMYRIIFGLFLCATFVHMSSAAILTPGDSWNRHDDYSVAGVVDTTLSVDAPNAGVWIYEYVDGPTSGALVDVDPWYDDTRISRVLGNYGAAPLGLSWQQDRFGRAPRSTQDFDFYIDDARDDLPVVRWQSPGDGVISIDGTFAVLNTQTSDSVDVDYAVVHLDSAGVVKSILDSGTLATTNTSAGTTLLNEEISVLEDESIIFTIRPQNFDFNVQMMTINATGGLTDADRVTITVVPEPSQLGILAVAAATLFGGRRWTGSEHS